MGTVINTGRLEIRYECGNPDQGHNLHEVPTGQGVFGIFGIVNEEPVNCRYVHATDNLQAAVCDLFENAGAEGLTVFMQGPWVKMLVYELMPGSSAEDRIEAIERWGQKFKPAVDPEGGYPGYYDYD